MILLTTLVLDIYIILLSLQVNGIMNSNFIRTPLLLFMIIECLVLFFIRLRSKKGQKIIHLPAIIVCAIAFLAYIICQMPAVELDISQTIQLLFFPFCLIVTYVNFIFVKDEKTFERIVDLQFYYLLVVSTAFFIAQIVLKGEYITNINTVYYTIFPLPFVLRQKSPAKKYIGLAIIFICLFLSLKRTPLIAVFLALIFYGANKESIKKATSKAVSVFICILVIDALFAHFADIHLLDRMTELSEDGGSGRLHLMQQAFELLGESSYGNFLLGHSLSATSSAFPRGAHNDFLEVFYRTGFVGFLIYTGYFLGIISMVVYSSREGNHQDASMLRSTLIMFAVVSCFSQLIFLPTYVGMIALSISFSIAHNRFLVQQKLAESINQQPLSCSFRGDFS